MQERFESRMEAGKRLVEFIKTRDSMLFDSFFNHKRENFCFAIPNGGVPIAEGFCSLLKLKYDVLIVRKIKIPYNPEAGFGSLTTDGTALLNEPLLTHLNLTNIQVNNAIELTKGEIEERLELYDKCSDVKNVFKEFLPGKSIFMIDDGLASGFTMMTAIKMVRSYRPDKVFIAVPTAPMRTIKKLETHVDDIFCPIIRHERIFAVANAYKHWRDIGEDEIVKILKSSKCYSKL